MKNLLPLLFMLVITSCSTIYKLGRDFDDTKVNTIIQGKTTLSEVMQTFGEPFKKGQINQFEVYIYTYEENEFPGDGGYDIFIDRRYKSLNIVFDEDSIVKFFSHNIPLSNGLLDLMMIREENKKQQQDNNQMNNMNNMPYIPY